MTVIQPNSISGINSITVQTGQALNIHDASGNLIRNITSSSGISTFSSLHVGSGTTTNTQGISVGTGCSIVSDSANILNFYTNNSNRLRIASSGAIQSFYNTSLPVTDSRPILQLGYSAYGDNSSGYNDVLANAYPVNGDSSYHYIGSSSLGATRYQLTFTDHIWSTASAGTRGNDITWTERARLDSSGRLLIGATSPDPLWGISAALAVEGTTGNTSAINIVRNSNDGSSPYLTFGKSRGTSIGSDTVVQSGDSVGTIAFTAADGTDKAHSASYIQAQIDGTPGGNDLPGRIIFATTSDDAASSTERVRIDKNGQLVLSNGSMSTAYGNSICGGTNLELDTTGVIKFRTDTNQKMSVTDNGLCFGSDSAAANALDDYEEGNITWHLRKSDATSTGSDNGSLVKYTKIGRVVNISGRIRTDSVGSTSNVFFYLDGTLPFTPATGGTAVVGHWRSQDIADGTLTASIAWQENSTTIYLYSPDTVSDYAAASNNVGANNQTNLVATFSFSYIAS